MSDMAAACPHCGHPTAVRDDYPRGLGPSDLTAAVRAEGRITSKEAARVERRAREEAAQQEEWWRLLRRSIGTVLLLLLGFGVLLGGKEWFSASSVPSVPSCKTDWTRCTDNADLVNNYSKMIDAKIDCQIAANKLATYGTPVWGYAIGIFGKFLRGSDFPRTGIVRLVDDDVQFSNAFGATQHYMVSCKYDLGKKRVLDVRTGLGE
jgi:hypothetical protein